MKLLHLLLLAFLLASAARGPAWCQVRIQAELDTTDILIGDHIPLRLYLGLDEGVAIEGIGMEALEGTGIELIETEPLQRASPQAAYQDFILSVYDSGHYVLPPLPVIYRLGEQLDTVFTAPLAFDARTILLPGDSTALQPIKPIVEEPLRLEDAWPYLAAVLGLALLAALLIVPWRRRRSRDKSPEPAFVHQPAHELALNALSKLETRSLWQQGQVKLYYSELTLILRRYLEQRFHIRTRERTTAEILKQLDETKVEKGELRNLLNLADLVKFAKAEPMDEQHRQSMQRVRRFVEETADDTVTVAIPAS